MARKTGRGGTRPTGDNARLQGKLIPNSATPDNEGPEDTPHSNGNWYPKGTGPTGNVSTPVIRGSRKSF